MNKHVVRLTFLFFFLLVTGSISLLAQDSSAKLSKLPKHYFNTVIGIDAYRKPSQDLDTVRALSRRLGSYGVKQLIINFHAPLATKNWIGADSSSRNSHLLLTATYMSLRPQFEGIKEHNLIKFGVGLRYIYNSGRKGVWFADVSPFVTRDVSFPSKPYYRMASTLLYSHNASPAFNWRLGITKSFLWGNRFYLPFVGIRIGRLDKINLSIQFPRSINLLLPLNSRVIFSLYTKPQGGLFNFSNADSLYPKRSETTFHFSRYELNSGLRFDFRMGKHFALYIATGLSTRNNISFYSEGANKKRKNSYYDTYFYSKNVPGTLFVNLGLVMRFGKTRSAYQDKNINDAIDINNTMDGNIGSSGLPTLPSKNEKVNLESVRDLVDYNDF